MLKVKFVPRWCPKGLSGSQWRQNTASATAVIASIAAADVVAPVAVDVVLNSMSSTSTDAVAPGIRKCIVQLDDAVGCQLLKDMTYI